MERSLQGRLALVTGAARGIGKGIAAELLRRGARVVIADVTPEPMAQTVRELSAHGAVDSVYMDVSDPASIDQALATVRERHGPVEILVNNAGIAKPGLFAESDPRSIPKALDVDLVGALYLTRRVLPGMLDRGWGRIANVSSMMAFTGSPGFAVYSTAKSGLLGFSEAIERELRRFPRIGVTVVLPPSVRTRSFAEAKSAMPTMLRWRLVPPISVARVARATVDGLASGRRHVYCGAQSFLASLLVRFAPWIMDLLLMQIFRAPRPRLPAAGQVRRRAAGAGRAVDIEGRGPLRVRP